MNSFAYLIVAAIALSAAAPVALAQTEKLCWVEGWKINPGQYELYMTVSATTAYFIKGK